VANVFLLVALSDDAAFPGGNFISFDLDPLTPLSEHLVLTSRVYEQTKVFSGPWLSLGYA